MRHSQITLVSVVALTAGLRLLAGCSGGARDFGETAGEGGSATSTVTTTTSDTTILGTGCGSIPDLRGQGITGDQAAIFQAPPGADAPFVFDPPSGVVLPSAWPSPQFLAHTESLPALAHVELSLGDTLVAFTAVPVPAPKAHEEDTVKGAWWTITVPTAGWQALQCEGAGPLTWKVSHAMSGDSAPSGAQSGTLVLLESDAQPDMSYWEIAQPGGKEDGFSIRRLAVESGTPQTLVSGQGGCIGCHTSSPDGQDVAYQRNGNVRWVVDVARPVKDAEAMPSPVVTAAARSLLDSTVLMVPATSPGAWSDATGRWIAAVNGPETPLNGVGEPGVLGLVQVDSASPKLSLAPELGPSKSIFGAATPAFAPDAKRIVYVASTGMVDGYHGPTNYIPNASADLWQISVTLQKDAAPVWGKPEPLPFASGTPENETFPAFSPDGKLLVFMRSQPDRGGYDEVTGDIWVMPADGSAPPLRIAANDAPTGGAVFAGKGLTNSWPRFGEKTIVTPEGTYYQLVFSSRRGSPELWRDVGGGSISVDGRPLNRLYLTMVRVAPNGTITTYPAALVPGQRVDAGAHTATFTAVTSVPPPPPTK